MKTARHPLRGGVSGFLLGLGLAVLALIYGLIRMEGPWLPLVIVLVFTALGVAFAMFWPIRESAPPAS